MQAVIADYLKIESTYWKEQLYDERKNLVPLSVCRICEYKFYADKATKHTKCCQQKELKQKEQVSFNLGFLHISSQVTQRIIDAEQEAVNVNPMKRIENK